MALSLDIAAHEYLLQLATDKYNDVVGTLLHLQHQQGLIPELRVIPLDDEALADDIKVLLSEKIKIEYAVQKLKEATHF